MTKSQLKIRLSSRKLDRRVSPTRPLRQTFRFNYRESAKITFIRATKYVEHVLRQAERDAGDGKGCWMSTHLVTIEVQVMENSVSHSSVIQATLNGSALVLLRRYINRFAEGVAEQGRLRSVHWLPYCFGWASTDKVLERTWTGRYE